MTAQGLYKVLKAHYEDGARIFTERDGYADEISAEVLCNRIQVMGAMEDDKVCMRPSLVECFILVDDGKIAGIVTKDFIPTTYQRVVPMIEKE